MSTKYPQGVITATPPFQSTTAQSFSGVWTLEQLGKNYFYYQQPVAKSLRFRSSASAYLNRTPSTGGNRTTWTWSGWIKRGALGITQVLFEATDATGTTVRATNRFTTGDLFDGTDSSSGLAYTTTQVFRDPSSWYHIVVAMDTTQTAAADRFKLYVNGAQVTSFSAITYPTLNASTLFNSTSYFNYIGATRPAFSQYFDGYLAEVNFIDGQALDPSYFGQLSTITGVWAPKKYVGSYGGNGFYLPFTNATSTTTLGYDSSGNGNNWTTNNISLTSGVTYDSMWDSPTSYDNGVNGVGNYAVFSVLPVLNASSSLSNGNLKVLLGGTVGNNANGALTTFKNNSGKWYAEFTIDAVSNGNSYPFIGITGASSLTASNISTNGASYCIRANGNIDALTVLNTAYGSSFTANDVCNIAVDFDAGKIWYGKNGAWFASGNPSAGINPSSSGISSSTLWSFAVSGDGNASVSANFGQRPFAYTPPTGFKALNTQNLPAVSIANGANHMAATLYTGTGTAQNIVNAYNSVSFQPDFVWIKNRSSTQSHSLQDSVRGATLQLSSNLTAAEITSSGEVTGFNSNGFSLGADVSGYGTNTNTATYVGWQWKAGGTAVTNTAGSITSSVSANPTAGFSVVTYTGTGANATVGHGLGVAPSMVIVKNRATAATSWIVYHASLSNTQALYLNTTDAALTSNLFWNNTSPTSSVFSVAAYNPTNQASTNIVAYCFAAIPGYSAFGSYTGNGSTNGPFVYCGFRPRYILIKRTDSSTNGDWRAFDTSRAAYNVVQPVLFPNLSSAEDGTVAWLDILSNGFKIRESGVGANGSGSPYIYAAFAENPFKYSLAR